jgi:hypothetical protein
MKVAKEVAEPDFARMCVFHRLDIDESEMDEKELESFTVVKSKLVKAIMEGRLVVAEDGLPTYHPHTPDAKPVTFFRATGASFMAMDQGTGKIAQSVNALTDMTRSEKGAFAKLEARDFKLCMDLVGLFLG